VYRTGAGPCASWPKSCAPLPDTAFDAHCRLCPRLAAFLDQVRQDHPQYHCAPVGPFGDAEPRLLIVGLAPGMHGANRTGRPFTGDFAGILLYRTLFDLGLSNMPTSESAHDDLVLNGVRISNAVKCLPPQNKPEPAEIRTCNRYLAHEIRTLPAHCHLLALGTIAHRAVLLAYGLRPKGYPFSHGATHALPDGRILTDSYHCSRYNTQTRRLTADMFRAVMTQALAAPAEA
jgi:uracil-DNA glycosylase